MIITVRQFLQLFTISERTAIFEAEKTNPLIRQWLELLRAGVDIDLTSSDTAAGLAALVQLGYLTEDRKLEILPTENQTGKHTLRYVSTDMTHNLVLFQCIHCLENINFSLPSFGEPSVIEVNGTYIPPQNADQWMGECA